MKFRVSLVLITLFVPVFTSAVLAQDKPGGAQTPAEATSDLRARLAEVEAKQAELHARANQLDEDLKPENIERSFAGIGSTRPEELREQRRRQLSIERGGVRKQLDLLNTSHDRLQSAILTADTRAFLESAQASSGAPINAVRMSSISPRLVVIGVVTLVGILGIVGLSWFVRRR